MREYALTLLVAAAVTYLLTPLVRRFAIAVGASHAPRERDVHTQPTPLLGGLAMYGGLAAGLLVAYRLTHLSTVFAGTRVAAGLLLAGGVIVVVGFVDDRWGLGALSKFACQVAAGVILVWSGAVVAWLPYPGGGIYALDSNEQTAVTILVVVLTINAVNFIDGLDGLAAGVVAIGAAAFFAFYYTLTKRLGVDELTGPALSSAVLAGVCLGFLPHNFHPARIFMGDTGAMLLGLLLAYAPISSMAQLDPTSLTSTAAYGGGTVDRFPEVLPLLLPAAILLIPYTDLVLAVVRRMRAGKSPFAADNLHLHHRLLNIGHSQRASVMLMYLWAMLFSGTVVLLSIIRTKVFVLAIVTVVAVLALLLASMPGLRPWARRGRSRVPSRVITPVSSPAPQVPAAQVHSAQGQAARDQAARDEAAREQVTREQVTREQAARKQAIRERAAQTARSRAGAGQAGQGQAAGQGQGVPTHASRAPFPPAPFPAAAPAGPFPAAPSPAGPFPASSPAGPFPAAPSPAGPFPAAPSPAGPFPAAPARAMPEGSALPAGPVPPAGLPTVGPVRGQIPPVPEW